MAMRSWEVVAVSGWPVVGTAVWQRDMSLQIRRVIQAAT